MLTEAIKGLAYLILHYYKLEDTEKKLAELTDDERQKVIEEITAQLGR